MGNETVFPKREGVAIRQQTVPLHPVGGPSIGVPFQQDSQIISYRFSRMIVYFCARPIKEIASFGIRFIPVLTYQYVRAGIFADVTQQIRQLVAAYKVHSNSQ